MTVADCDIRADVISDAKGRELKGPSTDAIDLDKCRHVTVRGCRIAVNDDAWAQYAKPEGRTAGELKSHASDVTIRNCRATCREVRGVYEKPELFSLTNLTMTNNVFLTSGTSTASRCRDRGCTR